MVARRPGTSEPSTAVITLEVLVTTEARQQDVVDLLLSQHNQVKALFAEVRTAQGKAKQEAFQRLVRLLAGHESAREQVVDPAGRTHDGDSVVEARLPEGRDAQHV